MSISIDIGTSEVKLVELNTVNDDAVVSKVHSKSTWSDLNSFDPEKLEKSNCCLLYTSPSPRDLSTSRMPSSA